MTGYIYLASPYSHRSPFVREQRYLAAMQEMVEHLRQGVAIYSPIVHCHELAKIVDLPKDAAFWEAYNFTMLRGSRGLWLLMLPGWEESVGCAGEVEEALRLSLPVFYISPKENYYE